MCGDPELGELLEERLRGEGLGPSTPVPDHAPAREQLEGDDGVEGGLPDDGPRAVLAHRRLVVDHVVQVRLPRVAVGAGARDERPGVFARIMLAERRRVGQRRRDDVARGDLDAPSPGSVLRVEPELGSVRMTSMNSSPSPYLKVTRLQSIQRGTSSTSSCSTLTHSTGPIPSGKSNTSGSEKGAVVNQPRSRSQITGGFRHSSIVVQIEKVGAKS